MSQKKIKTSFIWNFFTEKPNTDSLAVCNICKQTLSYKSSSNNLKKHITRKHPTININLASKSHINRSRSRSPINSKSTVQTEPQPSTSREANIAVANDDAIDKANLENKKHSSQLTVTSFLKKKMGPSFRKKIDECLIIIIILLFTHDFQPFSVVEYYGFKKFVSALNPSYELPSRKTISNT
ncbi:unnamed protein product [Psylliodes chrysocephalus]|uniref:BED-type domain-containing protein n=1 Tax=Psylliodes chrysocephalus TaxID=3402493 RepID=A0A9P0CV11_9CUCU|nr:unnamed protein product [Psylliodes chrysocephala]